jgi:hypothetical protein
MGSMSMSDAAPLPRLGEVFFDVRSASRSLRISWYADTGVAVLSIWQGGTCTGSFRLPMGDLPRMIETLQRGPDGQGIPAGEYPPQPAGAQPPPARVPDYPGEAGQPGAAAGYDAYQAGPGDAYQAGPADAYQAGPADAYQAGPGSLHYLNGSAPAQYPDQTGAGYPDQTGAGYPDQTGVGYMDGAAPARYPDETGAGYPRSATPAHYPDDKYAREPYPGEPYPGDRHAGDQDAGDRYADEPYPGDQYPRDAYPGDQYLNGTEPRDHSPQLADIDYSQPAPGSTYADGRPGRADEQQAPGPESVSAVLAGHGLEPLPESFPYGEPHRSHRL